MYTHIKQQPSPRDTSSARILEQLKQTQRMMESTVLMNPMWNIGLASSRCPKWPGHSAIPAMHVWHLILWSTVPIRGPVSPLAFGFPFSSLCIFYLRHRHLSLHNTESIFTIKLHDLNFVVQTLQMCRLFF